MTCGGSGACAFEAIHRRWQAGDMEGCLALCAEDIMWTVNADGLTMPYVASALGREDARWRIEHLLSVFHYDTFDPVHLAHDTDACRSRVRIVYIHRATGEKLTVVSRFVGWQRGGVLTRIEEHIDVDYVTAFDRFVQLQLGA